MTGSKSGKAGKGSDRREKKEGPGWTVLALDDDIAEKSQRVDSMMLKNLAHARIHLEEHGEESLVLEGDLKALEGVTSAVHASEEVEDDVEYGRWIWRKREAVAVRWMRRRRRPHR